jgi:NADH-quinone oxidoreductase subunit L
MSGFWSKEAVLGAAEETALHGDALAWAGWLVLVAGLLTGVVTAAYATRTWLLVVPTRREVPADVALVSADGGAERGADGDLRPPDVPAPAPVAVEPVAPVPVAMTAPLVLLAIPAAAGGLLLLGPVVPGEVHLSVATGVLAAALSVLGVAAAVLVARRHPDPVDALPPLLRRAFTSGFGVDAATDRVVVRPVAALAKVVVAGDRHVIDAYVRGAAASARLAGAGLRRTQTGVVTGYLSWLAVGAVVVAVAGVGLR